MKHNFSFCVKLISSLKYIFLYDREKKLKTYVIFVIPTNKTGGPLMKKIFLLFLLIFAFSAPSFSQSAGKGSGEKSEDGKRKPRKQMQHFEKRKKDPNMKHNGTSYKRNRKSKHKVDGDGFSTSGQDKRRGRRKKTGIN